MSSKYCWGGGEAYKKCGHLIARIHNTEVKCSIKPCIVLLEVWPPRFQSLLIMGWCSSKPEHRLRLPLDSVPMFNFLCIPLRDGSGTFLFPPSNSHPGFCPPEYSCLLSPFVLFSSSPSINAYSAAPLQCL